MLCSIRNSHISQPWSAISAGVTGIKYRHISTSIQPMILRIVSAVTILITIDVIILKTTLHRMGYSHLKFIGGTIRGSKVYRISSTVHGVSSGRTSIHSSKSPVSKDD